MAGQFNTMSVFILVFFLSTVFANPLHVMIDPGHGGRDSGAVRGKKREADITLSIAKKLIQRLKNDRRFEVSRSRQSDRYVSLQDRAKLAGQIKADVFISLHANTAPLSSVNGVEFYLQNQLPADEEMMFQASVENQNVTEQMQMRSLHSHPEVSSILHDLQKSYRISRSWYLANSMQKNWRSTRSREKSIRQAPFFLLGNVEMPSVLVELGFMSNKNDMMVLQRKGAAIARDLHRALIEYKEFIDKGRNAALQSAHAKK